MSVSRKSIPGIGAAVPLWPLKGHVELKRFAGWWSQKQCEDRRLKAVLQELNRGKGK